MHRTPAEKLTLAAALLTALALGGCARAAVPGPPAAPVPSAAATASAPASPPPWRAATRRPPAAKPKPAPRSSASSIPPTADNRLYEWNFRRNTKHKVPEIPTEAKRLAKRYGALYVGPDPKLVYLTFDEGYENGNTPKILDALAREGVHATFFVTGDFCREAPKLCKRMLAEGHVVGSHSDKHPSMPSLTSDSARFKAQFTRADSAFKKATGKHLSPLFRPPMGDYSAKSLAMTDALGYTTVFWSFAHVDYDEGAQPPVDTTISRVLRGSHPGAIYLLHAISRSDTAALPKIVDGLRKQGYEFGTL
jgi:peptidoglycan-N-acetylmuramic acid deacetylase